MCGCRKYPSSWRYYRTMDKFVTKTDNVINHAAVKITAVDRMKLLSETFVQGFAETCSWTIDTKGFFSLSLIKAVVILVAQQGPFLLVTTLHNPAQLTFFTAQFVPKSRKISIFSPAPCQMPWFCYKIGLSIKLRKL